MIPWWHKTTIYQIYPRSFNDSNSDGIGDLPGITEKLDYIADLGFETVWISPFYPSPLADHGYDITDYSGVAPEYGTMADFETLLDEAHRRGLKILLDLVLGHSSDQHPWFIESRSSRQNPKADWYIWRDGNGKRPPNNWIAVPGGSAWHYVPERDQWYMASFLPFQPDLNWRNPELKAVMFDMIRSWLRKGVDGFRLDLFTALFKDESFRNNPFRPGLYSGGRPCLYEPAMQHNHPGSFAFAKELRALLGEFSDPERILVGEVMGTKDAHRQLLGGENNDGLNLAFIFDMIFMLPWQRSAKWFKHLVSEFEAYFPEPFQPTLVFGNHDMRRLLSRIRDDLDLARVLAMFQLTARGIPTVYMGEETGMTDVFIPKSRAQDPVSKNLDFVPDALRRWLPVNLNRDMNRSPMQWTGEVNAGFCPPDAPPWLPVNDANRHERNVSVQKEDPESLLNLYRELLHLRRETPALHRGRLTIIDGLPPAILGYYRQHEDQKIAILLNFGKKELRFPFADVEEILFKSDTGIKYRNDFLTLRGKSGLIVKK